MEGERVGMFRVCRKMVDINSKACFETYQDS